MSKSYGRNQKRRARAAIADLEQQVIRTQMQATYYAAALRSANRQVAVVTDFLEFVEKALGPHTAVLPAQTNDSLRLDEGVEEFLASVFLPEDSGVSAVSAAPLPLETRAVRMYRLVSSGALDQMTGRAHFRVRLAGKELAYTVSQEVLETSTSEYLTTVLSPEIAREITAAMVKALRTRR